MKTDVTFIPVSGFTGANIKEPADRKLAPWVEGPPLLSFLDDLPITDRKNNAPLMIPISEKYADMGCVVVGKIESGKVRKGADLLLMPNKTPVQVQAIYNEMEEEVPLALSGDNIRLRLRGVEDTEINVGFVLSSPVTPVHTVTQFEAQLVILDTKNIITAGYGAVMHVHTASEEVTLAALLHYYDKKTGRKSRRPPQFAKKGEHALLVIAPPLSLPSPCPPLVRPSPLFARPLDMRRRAGGARSSSPLGLLPLVPSRAPPPRASRSALTPTSSSRTGMKIVALVEAANTVCIEPFSTQPSLGRFTLRDEGKTVAIGRVLRVITDAATELPDVAKLQLEAGSA